MAEGMNARPICSAIFVYALLILAVAVSRSTARPVANAPSCAVSCLETAARASGCADPHDEACVCSIRAAILQGSKSCIDQACVDQVETIDASEYLDYFCASVSKTELATNATLPSSAPTPPPSANPSPTNTSNAPSIHESSTLIPSSTIPSNLPGWSASGSPTVFADRAAETTAGGKDDDDDDKKESKSHKVGKIIGGVIGGIGGGLAAVMGIQSMFGGGTPCCCCCGCCGCGTLL